MILSDNNNIMIVNNGMKIYFQYNFLSVIRQYLFINACLIKNEGPFVFQ